ncbi:MAG: SMP-30/gluconolactonase/LRE family protein [Chloroflexi bacterium]|nr:SMP-30/gluconolactonase/LRE family protein [Chloroflexota bacterium]
MTREARIVLDNLIFPEGPRWHEGRLWFSDMHAHEVVAVTPGGERETIVEVANQPSGLGFLPDGRLLIVSMTDRKLLRLDPDGLWEVADISDKAPYHCNDMVTDAEGNSYIGNFGFDLTDGSPPRATTMVLVRPQGESEIVADGLQFPNGTVITPDGGTLIVGESWGQRLTAFDIEDDATLSNQRVWAELGFPPDGICLDAEGAIWVAVPTNPGALVRVAEGGEVLERIPVPDMGVFACMLGGDERKTLFSLEAPTSNPQPGDPRRGRIRAFDVEVGGAGLP